MDAYGFLVLGSQSDQQRGKKIPVGNQTRPGAKQTHLTHRGKLPLLGRPKWAQIGSWEAVDGWLTVFEKSSVL